MPNHITVFFGSKTDACDAFTQVFSCTKMHQNSIFLYLHKIFSILANRTKMHQNRKIRGLWVLVGLWLGFWCDPKYLKTTLCYEISPNENSVFWRVFSTFLILAFCITKMHTKINAKMKNAWKTFEIRFWWILAGVP